MSAHDAGPQTWGLLAEFTTGDELIAATRAAREAGYSRMDGYSPFPIGEVADELGFPRSEIGAVMFIGGWRLKHTKENARAACGAASWQSK